MNTLKNLFFNHTVSIAAFILFAVLFGGCDLFSKSMVEYFEDNTESVKALRAKGKTLTAVMEDGTILIPPNPASTKIGVELLNPRNFTVRLGISNNTAAVGAYEARQIGSSEIDVDITGPLEGEDYAFTLQMQSPDGLRDFTPYTMMLKCVSFETSLRELAVNINASPVSLSPPFDPNTSDYTAVVPYGTPNVTLRGTAVHPDAVLYMAGTSGRGTVSKTAPLSAGNNVFNVVVTAPSTTTRTYRVTVSPEPGITIGGIIKGLQVITFSGVPPTIEAGASITIAVGATAASSWYIEVNGPEGPTPIHHENPFSAPMVPGFYTVNVIAVIDEIPYSGAFSMIVE
ncbi:MAG: cadherin-like beta sandwich domain-containing protein [Treponema sp.]|jgi:hypothetical protein|nr:cadherin-like beta sandwich domain-containing protein [Treponema sp.]